jgi:hypothetical protein
MTSSGRSSAFAGFRFPREVIAVAVRWYLRYGLSYRDVGELLAERGVTVDHVTIYWWVQRLSSPPGPNAPTGWSSPGSDICASCWRSTPLTTAADGPTARLTFEQSTTIQM